MKRIERVNECVIRFANVNGSGSASANNLFAKAIFRLGIPVSPKNIFPSNIQGLPTWYEVRISERGFLGRCDSIDLLIAMNGQTLVQDYQSVSPGGYFLYDSTKRLPDECQREDLIVIGVPMTDLCNAAFDNPKLRQLLKNIIYVGALARLLSLDLSVLTEAITRQYAKNPKLGEPNLAALQIGYDYVREHFDGICGLTIEGRDLLGDAILIDGNTATALGALYAGATVVGWYPITPSTSVIESFEKYCNSLRIEPETGLKKVAIIQAEDELAAVGIVIGASWNGARAFTATSGPGLSLMAEFLGLAYFAEVPVVLIDVQRAGPSTGMPTRTQQADILAAAYASHGDTKNVLLLPADPAECFALTATAFDLAERLQSPVIVMSDLDLGMNDHISAPLDWQDERRYDRGKVVSAADLDQIAKWGRYLDIDGDGICYRTYPGTHPQKGAYFTRGSSHNEFSAYTEDNTIYRKNMDRLAHKWDTAKTLVPEPVIEMAASATDIGVIYYGTSSHATKEALAHLAEGGIQLDAMRLKAYPFASTVADFISQHRRVFVVEQNRDGQLRSLLITECGISPASLIPVLHYDGLPITARAIEDQIKSVLATTAKGGQP